MRHKRGFTLVELLIVIVVIAILAAISVVVYRGLSNRANDTAVKSDLTQMHRAYSLNAVDEEPSFYDISDNYVVHGSEGQEINGRYFTPITGAGQDKLKQLFGLLPERPYYYSNAGEVSMVYEIEYVESYDVDANRFSYAERPVLYARSASGKVFRHDGKITQDFGSSGGEYADNLRQLIADLEEELRWVDSCISGVVHSEECEGLLTYISEADDWQSELAGAQLQVAEWRDELSQLTGSGYSLTDTLPNCGSAYVFI